MACIGDLSKQDGSFIGQLRMLSISTKIRIVPIDTKGNAKAPDWHVLTGVAGGAEIGAAWSKTNRAGRSYLSVKLDDPSFPAPAWARLMEVDGGGLWELIWSRETARTDQGAGS